MTMDCLRDGEENSLSNGLAANNRLCNDSTSTSATSSTVDSNENENDTLGVKVEKSSPDFREAVRNENIREGKEIKDEDDVPLLQRKQKMGSHKKKVGENHKIQNCERKEKIVIINDISVKPEPSSPKKHTPDEKPVIKRELKRPVSESDSEDDVPLSFRAKKAKRPSDVEQKKGKKRKSDDDDERYSPVPKKEKKKHKHHKHHHHSDKKKSKHKDEKGKKDITGSPSKKQKQDDQLKSDVWKWWEDDSREEGIKWKTLEHSGPLFAAPYEPLPKAVKMKYEGKSVALSEAAEEVATFYARMLDHDYTSKPVFRKNFFKDWRKVMTSEERASITDLGKCDFRDIHKYFQEKSEERKQMSKEEKQKIKVVKEKEQMKHGFAYMDGYKQKIGNFRIEPPGLFRGRGEHPRMGKLKKRVMPEDVIINCSKGSKVPSPPAGHKWKEVRHDNTVTWLCSWVENVLGQNKYVMLNPSSKIKGQKDWEKYEVARKLKGKVDEIRDTYTNDFKSKEMRSRQRAVALYFIDRLALRAGNEKDDTEAADTVGCCSLRCEHITLHDTYTFDDERGEKPHVVEFDFLGKDSIRYTNLVPVEKRVYKNLQIFMENKKPQDDLFDRLDTASLNKHLQEQMPGLTAKVFRTYNASITLQRQLDKLTREEDSMPEKLLSYNRANREVAILCNHQRSVPKSHENSMKNLKEKIKNKKKEIKEAKELLDSSRRSKDEEKVKKKLARFKEQLKKLKLQETDKDEGKTIALGTSKLNYLDPRITVAWCKKHDVPIEKAYNKTQREKFHWAIEMAGPNFVF